MDVLWNAGSHHGLFDIRRAWPNPYKPVCRCASFLLFSFPSTESPAKIQHNLFPLASSLFTIIITTVDIYNEERKKREKRVKRKVSKKRKKWKWSWTVTKQEMLGEVLIHHSMRWSLLTRQWIGTNTHTHASNIFILAFQLPVGPLSSTHYIL